MIFFAKFETHYNSKWPPISRQMLGVGLVGEGLMTAQWCNRGKVVLDRFGRTYSKYSISPVRKKSLILFFDCTVGHLLVFYFKNS